MSHIPEDRHKHGLVLDYSLEQNMVLQRYYEPEFSKCGFIRFKAVKDYAENLIDKFDVRSSSGAKSTARSMSGGNQQKAIVAREMDRAHNLLVAVQPTRELGEVINLSDRILVMYEGEIVGELDPKKTTVQELGLYMAGAKRDTVKGEANE